MSNWQITRKDLKLLARDLRTVFILLALPLIFIAIIGMTTGQLLGWKSENQLLRIAIVDNVNYDEVEQQNLSAAGRPLNPIWARNIVTKLIDNIQELEGVVVKPALNREVAQEMVEDGDANAAVVLQPQFLERVLQLDFQDLVNRETGLVAEGPPGLNMEILSRSEQSTTHALIETIVFMHTIWTAEPYLLCGVRTQDIPTNAAIRQRCSELTNEADEPLREREFLTETPSAERQQAQYDAIIPGYVVLFAFFLVNAMANSFIEEQKLGTMRRLRIAPVRPASLLLGKTMPFFIVSVVQIGLLFLCGRLLFGMSWGPEPWLLIPIVIGTSLAATGLGLVVATLVKSEAQVSAYATLVVITMAGISGCFMPRDWLPELMQDISLITPHAWALMAYSEALTEKTPSTTEVLQFSGMLAAFAAAYFAIGAWRFRTVE